ncbi:MAG: ATP-dependent DNA helicase RecG [Planctomycetaceae bacterium]|nr:ATP-dependent DNA helicase RecG [Planctomycetaceae bacterium]
MSQPTLDTPVQFVRGVGPQRAELLGKLGITTLVDLLWHLPRDILDLTHVADVRDLKNDELQTVRGRVVDVDGRQLSGGKTLSAVLIDCDGEYVRGIWFNRTWVNQRFRHGEMVLFSGKPGRRGGRWEMSHPRIQWLDADDTEAHGGVLPRYGLTEGLRMHEMRRLMRQAVDDYAGLVPELLPEALRTTAKLPTIPEALRSVHLPASAADYAAGRSRLILQDLLEFQLGLALRRRSWQSQGAAPRFPTTAKIDARIRRLFPFEFTKGQNRAVRDLARDLDSGQAMQRLLQADVGAGKTVVAVYGLLVAIAAGWQGAIMAPTEILARQHWQTIDRMLAQSRVERLLLTGQLTAAERRDALARISSGAVQLVIGTQALIQSDVVFGKLGLVVIDEQHKFGVMQRARFSAGDGSVPHLLVMTATPIPRSLCLTQFGDLDLTAIADLPPGRQSVVTSRVPPGPARVKAWEFIRKKLQSGRQAFVVCPRIAEQQPQQLTQGGSEPDGASAEAVFRQLAATELEGFRLGLLHGQLESDNKERAMDEFRSGRTQVLVATTIVEVGVDIPNATLMIVQRAESFGLSQLHQLRGRIGRGTFQGYCFLFSETIEPDAQQRLLTLEQHAGGFEVAEADFRLRGPGDVLGTRQHGDLPLQVADLVRDQAELETARELAFDLVRSGRLDQPEFAPLKIRVLERFGTLLDLAGSG